MTTNRLPQGRGRGALARLQILIYRHQGVRWLAAAGAALAAFVALNTGDAPEVNGIADGETSSGVLTRLPRATRGVPVPIDEAVLAAGDVVDLHAVFDSSVVASSALVSVTSKDHAIVAVPVEQVTAVVDAITTGGVIPVLVPRPQDQLDTQP